MIFLRIEDAELAGTAVNGILVSEQNPGKRINQFYLIPEDMFMSLCLEKTNAVTFISRVEKYVVDINKLLIRECRFIELAMVQVGSRV